MVGGGGGGSGHITLCPYITEGAWGEGRDESAGGCGGEIAENYKSGGNKEEDGGSDHDRHRKTGVALGFFSVGVLDDHCFILTLCFIIKEWSYPKKSGVRV